MLSLFCDANAIDPEGNVGVITADFDGGTIGATYGTATSQGLKYIFPVGPEKMVPSVKEAAASKAMYKSCRFGQ